MERKRFLMGLAVVMFVVSMIVVLPINEIFAVGGEKAITCGMAPVEDSVGIFDPNANPNEFEGRVVNEAGRPIEGVLVDAWDWYPGNETTTDVNGFFRITNFRDDKFIEVRFSKENYSPLLIVRQRTGVKNAVIVLNDKTYFEGMVKGANSLPAANALIRADQGPKRAEGVMITSIWTETKSDADGRYRLYVQPDSYDIQVKVDGLGVARLQDIFIDVNEQKQLDITLRQGNAFRAKVVDSESNEPVAGVRLWHWQHKGIEGKSDANGIVVIEGMLPGKFEFMVDAPGYARWWSEQCASEWNRFKIDEERSGWQRNFDDLDFDIKDDMQPILISVEKAVRIRGKIVDPNGNPVGGATAAPARSGSGNSLTGDTRFSVTTKPDGTFEMLLPASGKCQYNLVAHDGTYQQWRTWANGVTEPFKTTPGQEINDVIIKLTQPGEVTGCVVDEKGAPVADREVRAQAADKLDNRYYDATVKTDANGRYELKFVRPCKQYIQVAPFWLDANQAPEGTSKIVDVNAGQVINDVNLVIENTEARQRASAQYIEKQNRANSDPNALAIFDKVVACYKAMKTYSDSIEVNEASSYIDANGTPRTSSATIKIVAKLARPELYRVEWTRSKSPYTGLAGGGYGKYSVTLDANKAPYENYCKSYDEALKTRPKTDGDNLSYENFRKSSIFANAHTGNSLQTVSAMFFGDSPNMYRIPANLRFKPDETIDGNACYVITGKQGNLETTYWISKQSLLVYKRMAHSLHTRPAMSEESIRQSMEAGGKKATAEEVAEIKKRIESMPLKSETVLTEIHRNIVIDAAIPAKEFEIEQKQPAEANSVGAEKRN